MKKEIWLIVFLAAVILILTAVILLPSKAPEEKKPQGAEGLEINSPLANSEVSSPLKVSGRVTGNGWAGFEGQVGAVYLYDKDGRELGFAILTATTEWTSLPTIFETSLNFESDKDQEGSLVFNNENPSGDPGRNKEFVLPVKIKKGGGKTTTVKVYFNTTSQSGEDYTCENVLPAERIIKKTQSPARAALEELLKGPNSQEHNENGGYVTSINPGVKIQSLNINTNGTAHVDFDENLEKNVGGSCKVAAIRAQITQTLKQFPTVKNVVISINGKTEDILQP